jgi:Mitochondrial carrier protein
MSCNCLSFHDGALSLGKYCVVSWSNDRKRLTDNFVQFYTYNFLASRSWINLWIPSTLIRNAGIGLAASVVSDVAVNAVRVIKTTKQSLGSRQAVTYAEAIRIVLAADGWRGLFGRGLSTRIYCNALQSIVFTVIWRALADRWQSQKKASSQNEQASPEASS